MSKAWMLEAERRLMDAHSPSVLTTAMLQGWATAGRDDAPSATAFARWLARMRAGGKLRQVVKGVYLNRLGHRDASPAAAAHWIRHGSVVSLSWVLEQAGLTNNFGDTVTCVVPIDPAWPNPQVGDRLTAAGPFRFFALPAYLVDERAGALMDRFDPRFDYPRTTPEKAFLDWLYLGASPRSRLTAPPLDVGFDELDRRRLRRLAKRMGLTATLHLWEQDHGRYRADADVQANVATGLRL